MPCYEVKLNNVEFKAKHLDVLKKSLQELNIYFSERNGIITFGRITINTQTETASFPKGEENKINEIKMKYSEKMISQIAIKKRWIVKMKEKGIGQIIKY